MNIKKYFYLKPIFLLFPLLHLLWSCCSTKQSNQITNIPLEKEFVEIKVKKIDDTSDVVMGNYKSIIKTNEINDSVNNQIKQKYQIPFSPSTIVKYFVEKPDSFIVSLIDLKGNTIKESYHNFFEKGFYEISFLETNINSGVYFIEVKNGLKKWSKRIILLK